MNLKQPRRTVVVSCGVATNYFQVAKDGKVIFFLFDDYLTASVEEAWRRAKNVQQGFRKPALYRTSLQPGHWNLGPRVGESTPEAGGPSE